MPELTILPERQEANTAVLGADSRILDSYWKGAEMEFRKKQQAYNEKKDEADRLIKTLDFDKAGIRPQDLDYITDYAHENVYGYAAENPEALLPSMSDRGSLEKANQFNENFGQAKYLASKSKLLKAQYDKYKEHFVNTRDTEGLQALDKWYAQDLEKIGDFDYKPSPDNDVVKLGGSYEKELTTGTTAKTTPSRDPLTGQIINDTITTQNIDLAGLPALAQSTYDSDPQWRMQADKIFNELTPEEQKSQYGGNPANVIVELTLPHIKASTTQKQSFRTDWQSQFGASQAAKNPAPPEYEAGLPITTEMHSETSGKAGIGQFKLIGGWDLSKTGNAPSNILIRQPKYAVDPSTGKFISADEIGTDAWNVDVISIGDAYYDPKNKTYYSDDGSLSAERKKSLQKRRQALVSRDGATYLIPYDSNLSTSLTNSKAPFVPPLEGGGKSQQSETIKVSLNGQVGEIPADQWEAFKKKYPNAVKQ